MRALAASCGQAPWQEVCYSSFLVSEMGLLYRGEIIVLVETYILLGSLSGLKQYRSPEVLHLTETTNFREVPMKPAWQHAASTDPRGTLTLQRCLRKH